jgi:COP9 signalosome complex subunit 6
MADQYTRISTGGSPLDKNAPVVGLLFGLVDEDSGVGVTTTTSIPSTTAASSSTGVSMLDSSLPHQQVIQIRDADDIPVDISDVSKLQVDLHTAVFPKHKVVGWYRATIEHDEEPSSDDLAVMKTLKAHYAPSSPFCFCLLQVGGDEQQQLDTKMKGEGSRNNTVSDTLHKDLPINLFCLHEVDTTTTVLLGIDNWQLATSESERIAVERVMREKPSEVGDGTNPLYNPYVLETQAIQHSLSSMKARVDVISSFLIDTTNGTIPINHSLLRQIHTLVTSLGPLSTLANSSNDGEETDVQMLTHLALVAKTVNAIQSYTEKFCLVHENRRRFD